MKTVRLLSLIGLLCGLAIPAALQAQSTPNAAVARTAAYNVSSQPAAATQPPPPVVNGPPREYVILTGGPSLTIWEKYKSAPHDQFWGSFTRASRTRFQQLQLENGNDPNALYTWLVFEDGYRSRGAQDHQDYVSDLNSVRDKYHLHMVPVENGVAGHGLPQPRAGPRRASRSWTSSTSATPTAAASCSITAATSIAPRSITSMRTSSVAPQPQ